MGTKRTHAETKDGFTKPSPAKGGLNGKQEKHKDKKDKRKNGEEKRDAPGLVRLPLISIKMVSRW